MYSRGRRRGSPSFLVFALLTDSPLVRFGLTTPRKLGRANERNRVRRRVREMLRRERATLAPGFDIVINPRRTVLTGDFEALRNELRELLEDLVRRP